MWHITEWNRIFNKKLNQFHPSVDDRFDFKLTLRLWAYVLQWDQEERAGQEREMKRLIGSTRKKRHKRSPSSFIKPRLYTYNHWCTHVRTVQKCAYFFAYVITWTLCRCIAHTIDYLFVFQSYMITMFCFSRPKLSW